MPQSVAVRRHGPSRLTRPSQTEEEIAAQQADLILRPKTFDQQIQLLGDNIVNEDIWPNRRIAGEIVFEPLGNGVRVTRAQ